MDYVCEECHQFQGSEPMVHCQECYGEACRTCMGKKTVWFKRVKGEPDEEDGKQDYDFLNGNDEFEYLGEDESDEETDAKSFEIEIWSCDYCEHKQAAHNNSTLK